MRNQYYAFCLLNGLANSCNCRHVALKGKHAHIMGCDQVYITTRLLISDVGRDYTMILDIITKLPE